MHESAMRVRPLSCPFDREVMKGRVSKCACPVVAREFVAGSDGSVIYMRGEAPLRWMGAVVGR